MENKSYHDRSQAQGFGEGQGGPPPSGNPPPYNAYYPSSPGAGGGATGTGENGFYPNLNVHGQGSGAAGGGGGGDFPGPRGPVVAAPTVQVQVVTSHNLRDDSTRLTCPYCKAEINTRVRYESGRFTHVVALILCLVGCWPCCLIPYCADSCMDAEHECPNCNRFIGMYRR